MTKKFRIAMPAFLLVISITAALAQNPAPDAPTPQPAPAASTSHAEAAEDSGRVGIGVKVSSLGVGGEAAVRILRHANLRAGFNAISYSHTFTKDGISYDGQIDFKTFEAHFDYFPWAGGFHISPGILAYIGDPITVRTSIAGGQSFTLGGTTFYSDPATPATGNGKITFNQAAPMITVGWGNLVPRSHKHFVVSVEAGAAFQGSPKTSLNFSGNVCDSSGVNCRSIAGDSAVQSSIVAEQNKINNDLSFFKAYPIVSVGFGYKF